MDINPHIDSALKRLETDLKVARENWYNNPFLAQTALMDLVHGADYAYEYLANDPEANKIASELPVPNVDEVMGLLHHAYINAGVNMNCFTPDDDVDELLPNPYQNNQNNRSKLPQAAREFIEKVLEAVGDDPQVEAYVVTNDGSDRIK